MQELKDDLVSTVLPSYDIAPDAIAWAAESIDYNVPGGGHLCTCCSTCLPATFASFTGGKLNRGLSVVHTVLAVRGAATTEREARLAAVAGWCLEWLQAFFLVADDVMDGSVTRRGQPCWYKRPAVGLVAFNDSCCLLGEVRQGQ